MNRAKYADLVVERGKRAGRVRGGRWGRGWGGNRG